jgi:hypothetical protein
MENSMLKYFLCILFITLVACKSNTEERTFFKLVHNESEQQVDIFIKNKLFTSYLYSDTIAHLKKPVLYPINSPKGNPITRGFPLNTRPAERIDHFHHIGFWLNYGDVNGLDFWNNSDAIPKENAARYGQIKHRQITKMIDGVGNALLEVFMDWLKPDGTVILEEKTQFIFYADSSTRAIDRITQLSTVDEPVDFKDNKEGMIAIRVARSLEHPDTKPILLSDAEGKAINEPVLDNEGVVGQYLSSEGIKGIDVWGTRAKWISLSGAVNSEKISVTIFDHPQNIGYPTYWHARGYGLFAANPLGQKVFSNGKEELNFSLQKGESVVFKHRILIKSGETSSAEIEQEYQQFVQN